MSWKWKQLSTIERVGFGVFGAFAAFATVAIAVDDSTTADEFIFVIVAALFTAALWFGAFAGRFPEMPNHRQRKNENIQRKTPV